MKETRADPAVKRKVIAGVVKTLVGSLLISFEFYAGNGHGFTSLRGMEGIAGNLLALCMYSFGLVLIYSAIRNCPFSEGSQSDR